MTDDHSTAAPTPASAGPIPVLVRVMAKLLLGYQNAAAHDMRAQRLAELRLADTALRDLQEPARWAARPLQVVVMGPTQVGKSTVVNLLLGQSMAAVSPLAGFTVHPHGFVAGLGQTEPSWLEPFFAGWSRCPQQAPARERLDCYGFTVVAGDAAIGQPAVIWDTPDFDSLKAHSYQRGVLETAALADVLVLVVSKEKYADLSVWNSLQLLQPLQCPLVVCLNKITEDARVPIQQALRQRLDETAWRETPVQVVTLPHDPAVAALTGAARPAAVAQLHEAVVRALAGVDRAARAAGVRRLLQYHWAQWTTPVVGELAAARAWRQAVDAGIEQVLSAYREEFLDHPQRFDTFRRAVLELLMLLELPGFARALTRLRHALTWPARQLFNARAARALGRRVKGQSVHDLPGEERVLRDLLEALRVTLARDALRRSAPDAAGAAFWQALSERLAQCDADLDRRFADEVHRYHAAFQPQVQAAAQELYQSLQGRPALLNTLRAARVTADAAAVALAVKTAGLGLNDLLFAPAMVSLTSMLTEGALGTYMTQVASRLKQRQYEAVEQEVLRGPVRGALHGLADGLSAPGLFGVSEAEYEGAQQALEHWGHG